jgi:hypothetical protein
LATYLKLLCPLPDIFIILADVFGVEVGECLGAFRVDPDLTEDACVDVAHQDLAYRVEAVCWIN